MSVSHTLQEVIHLAAGQVGAVAVARIVETEEGEVGTPRHQERSQTVEGGRIVQPAVQRQPLRAGGRTFATIVEIIISDSVTMSEPHLLYSPRRWRWSTACPL